MNNKEIWKEIPGYGGYYEASSLGRIRVKDRWVVKNCSGLGLGVQKQFYKGRVFKLTYDRGYMHVNISVDGKRAKLAAHRAVLLAFVGEPENGQEACHENGVSSDNRIDNLRWDSHFENNQDRKRHGRYAHGEKHVMAKLSDKQIEEIRSSGLNGPQVSEKYGIGTSQAHRILTRKSRFTQQDLLNDALALIGGRDER